MTGTVPLHDHFAGRRERLWLTVLAPIAWAVHFLLCYVTAAIWCARVPEGTGTLGASRLAVLVYTGLALLLVGGSAWRAHRAQRLDAASPEHAEDRPEARHAFLGTVTLLLAGLSAIAIIHTALVAVFIGDCR